MAGAGSRFKDSGYTVSKPLIPTTDRRSGKKVPMVVAAALDIPGANDPDTQIVFIDRDFHKNDGVHETILSFFPKAKFVTIDYLTEGQAATCLLARPYIDNDGELFIGACDNGIDYTLNLFNEAKEHADCLVISHTDDANIERNPNAHSWADLHEDGKTLRSIFIKKTVSDTPMNDHATTGMFWFRHGRDFVAAADKMIGEKDKAGGEYYVDRVIQYLIDAAKIVRVFDVTYICWGTPRDYEDYEKTISYWKRFQKVRGIW